MDERIQEKFHSLRAEEEASSPSFERVLATAQSRRAPRASVWALRGLALASVPIVACAMVLAFAGPTGYRLTSPSAADGANRASDVRVPEAPPEAAVDPLEGPTEAPAVPVTTEPASKRAGAKPVHAGRRPRTANPSDACATCSDPQTDSSDPCATC